MTRKIAVIGAGTAGVLNAAHLCTWLDTSWQVCSIYDPHKKILGIGESTNGAFVSVLERATNFSLAHADDLAALDATIKFGSKIVGWRQQSWINPLLSGNVAIHFNTLHFKEFVFERLASLWPNQFSTLEADVQDVESYADHVTLVTNQGRLDFDYVVDCMGTPSSFQGYTLSDCTLMDRCRVHAIEHYDYEPFTEHIATRDGWMFGVPLKSCKTYGYLYNHQLTETEAAEEEMKRLLGVPRLDSGRYDAHYAFRCYYANELLSGRVFKNGNKALFFEPLLANSQFLYIYAARLIYDHIVLGQEASRCNALFVRAVQQMEDVISYYYKGGSTYDSEAWRSAAEQASSRLQRRTEFSDYLRGLAQLKQKGVMHSGGAYGFSPQSWQIVDEHMGYGSFDAPEEGA